ncbi:hypothetical protein [Acinetobacter colistiniresistens]|uniref:Uncharacterized protein n=1 Tax=Acinetobacter colistiniresistens TaxID=280145 RepID=A0A558EW77_9GAMM|nr:hypothetical protein [Acinetobacter colistiniresistens]TVT77634.1 hypothetical protein FPV60_18560 [Acinetobacter colistiniresistens]
MRSEFEKNVMHKQIIDRVRFSEKANQYLPIDASSGVDRGCADAVNVGWISYQYQQSKVDDLQKRIDTLGQALRAVADMNSHPVDHESRFGSWGVRDFYRNLALKALNGGESE